MEITPIGLFFIFKRPMGAFLEFCKVKQKGNRIVRESVKAIPHTYSALHYDVHQLTGNANHLADLFPIDS